MPILDWLNNNTKLQGKIVRPIKTITGNYRFDDNENVFLLFDYIDGEPVGKNLTPLQLLEAAEIIDCLHSNGDGIPFITDKLREDFSLPFCYALERFIADKYLTSPADVKLIIQPYLKQLSSINDKVKLLSEKLRQKYIKMVLCHTDAHGYNLIQSKNLILVDWEGIKLAPAEADLFMFLKKEYWDIFFGQYTRLRPDFKLDTNIFRFYILRRKIEDIWAFIEGILYNNLSTEERERDLQFLLECCKKLDDFCFELI